MKDNISSGSVLIAIMFVFTASLLFLFGVGGYNTKDKATSCCSDSTIVDSSSHGCDGPTSHVVPGKITSDGYIVNGDTGHIADTNNIPAAKPKIIKIPDGNIVKGHYEIIGNKETWVPDTVKVKGP